MQKKVEKAKCPTSLSCGLKGGAQLTSKNVRLWSGLDDGFEREVRLHCTPEGHFRFEVASGSESAIVPIEAERLQEALNLREVRIESPAYSCRLTPLEDRIAFCFDGHISVHFAMHQNQLAVLVQNLGQLAITS